MLTWGGQKCRWATRACVIGGPSGSCGGETICPNTKQRMQPQIVVANTAYHTSLCNPVFFSLSLRPALHTGPLHDPLRSSLTAICTSRHSPHHLPANRWNATADSTRHDPRVYQTSRAQPRCQTSYLQCSSLPPLVRIPHIPRSPSLFTPFPPSSRVRVA
jgi:hypothetical protein